MSRKPALSPKLAALQQQVQQAMHLHQSGLLQGAELVYRQVLSEQPKQVDALHLLGVLCVQTGRADEGVSLIQQALKLNGLAPAIHSNLGNALLAAGRPPEAIAAYNKALALQPQYPDALCNKGNALRELQQLEAAIACYDQAIALQPQLCTAWSNRGNALNGLHRADEALQSYDRALAIEPRFAEAWSNRGVTLTTLGRLDEALQSYAQALALQPDHPDTLSNLGNTLREVGRLQESIDALRQSLAVRPDHADTLSNLGIALQEAGHTQAAIDHLRQALAKDPQHLLARSNLLFSLSFDPNCSGEAYLEEARRYDDALKARWPVSATPSWPTRVKGAPLRIGVVSGDLRSHPVGYFLEGLLAALPKDRVQVVALSTRVQRDALSERLASHCTGWHVIGGMHPQAAAALIREQAIDVLVDLAGHTAGHMLEVFAQRAAPTQLSWLGYFASTGLSAMDAVLADALCVPEGEERACFTERVVRLPHTRLSFTPPQDAPDVAPLPALSRGHLTLGTFQPLTKLNDAVLGHWATLMRALPTARLRLQNRGLGDAPTREAFVQRAQAAGLDAQRLELHGAMPRQAYLQAHAEVDFIVDSHPFPGGTTTCEALWMGVPTLTWRGHSMLSRQGECMMTVAGLPDWVAQDASDWVARGALKAQDLAALSQLRERLRQQVRDTALFNPTLFARDWLAAIETLADRGT